MAQQQKTTGRAAQRGGGRSRMSPWQQQQQQRTRPAAVSSTRLFSEGEDDGGSAAASEPAESGGEAAGEAGAAAVVEEFVEEKPMSEAEMAQQAKMAEIERLRAKEKFITAKTGVRVFLKQPVEGWWTCCGAWAGLCTTVVVCSLGSAGKYVTLRKNVGTRVFSVCGF